jgi:hypothetical protein
MEDKQKTEDMRLCISADVNTFANTEPCLQLAADMQLCGSLYKELASSLRVPSGHAFPIAETLEYLLEKKNPV